MDTQVRGARWQCPEKSEIRNILERLKRILWYTVAVIASCREAQARRRIQLYFEDQGVDELAKMGKYDEYTESKTIKEKVIVKEVVMLPCEYCGSLMPQTSLFCPHCGARRKN